MVSHSSCGFWSKGIIGPFSFENEQGEAVTVNDDRYRALLNEFCSEKLKRRILATFGFNRTELRATQPKLHSMVCALFLKIALLATELMAFGHLGVAIWHRWSIIYGVPSKIMVFSFLPQNVHFISKNAISCLFLKNVSPFKWVICFILNNLHFPMVEGIAFYEKNFFGYKNTRSKFEVEKVAIWQYFSISGKHIHFLNICVLSFSNKKLH